MRTLLLSVAVLFVVANAHADNHDQHAAHDADVALKLGLEDTSGEALLEPVTREAQAGVLAIKLGVERDWPT